MASSLLAEAPHGAHASQPINRSSNDDSAALTRSDSWSIPVGCWRSGAGTRELCARADRQHAAVLAGDELVGVYGEYPPLYNAVVDDYEIRPARCPW